MILIFDRQRQMNQKQILYMSHNFGGLTNTRLMINKLLKWRNGPDQNGTILLTSNLIPKPGSASPLSFIQNSA